MIHHFKFLLKEQRGSEVILNVILGVNIDTPRWIESLQKDYADDIMVVDYDYFYEPEVRNGVTFMGPVDAKEYMKKFDSVNYYKSLYAYPGIKGRMSTFFKKSRELKRDEPESFPL